MEEILKKLAKEANDFKLDCALNESVILSTYQQSFENMLRNVYKTGYHRGMKNTLENLEKILKDENNS